MRFLCTTNSIFKRGGVVQQCISVEDEAVDWLQLYLSDGIGPRLFFRLVEQYGTVRKVLDIFPMLERKVLRNGIQLVSRAVAQRAYERCIQSNITVLLAKDSLYPAYLKELFDRPAVLFVKGNLNLFARPSLAIVGARNASIHSQKFAFQLAHDVGSYNVNVVSGLARGIDTVVHQGSLSTGTIAVVANGLDVVYPPENKELSERIACDGLLVSEFSLGTFPKAGFFPRRNRIIAGLAHVVVIVEAALSSGSLITARYALEQGREVGAVPGNPADPRSRGTNSLIKQGAFVVEDADDVLSFFREYLRKPIVSGCSQEEKDAQSNKKTEGLSETKHRILAKLSVVPTEIDVLLVEMQLAPNVLLAILLELELAGLVKRYSGNKVMLCS